MLRHPRRAALALLAALAAALTVLIGAGTAAATVGSDDYPYASSTPDTVDPWNFYTRECTSFVAWRLNNDNGIPFSNSYAGQHWGNAEHWDDAAAAAGIAVDSNPTPGSVAVFNPGVDGVGAYGHVAYVLSAGGGSVTVEDYNWISYAYDQHSLSASGVVFIHFGSSGGATGTVNTGGQALNVRSGPSTSDSVVGSLADGAVVTISCQTDGETVTGTYGTTATWDQVGSGFVSDSYVYTGSDGRVAPDC